MARGFAARGMATVHAAAEAIRRASAGSWALVVTLVLSLLLGSGPGIAGAADCGGLRPCSCGDRVVEDYQLTGPLGPCAGDGLRMVAGVTLNGGGHAIRGVGRKSGVVLDEGSHGAVVRNLHVTGFYRGVRLAGVRGATVQNVRSWSNGNFEKHAGYGIEFARGASGNRVVGVEVHGNADEGIHIGTDANRNVIDGAKVADNFREGIYFLENSGNRVENSEIRGGGAAAAYIKFARGTVLRNNHILERPVQLRGSSDEVVLEGNRLERASVIFEPFQGVAPRGVTIRGGRIDSPGGACVRVRGAREVRVENVTMQCRPSVSVNEGSTVAVVGAAGARVQCRGSGSVTFDLPAGVRFVDENGNGVEGVSVEGPGGRELARSDRQGALTDPVPMRVVTCPGRNESAPMLRLRKGSWNQEAGAATLRKGIVLVPGG